MRMGSKWTNCQRHGRRAAEGRARDRGRAVRGGWPRDHKDGAVQRRPRPRVGKRTRPSNRQRHAMASLGWRTNSGMARRIGLFSRSLRGGLLYRLAAQLLELGLEDIDGWVLELPDRVAVLQQLAPREDERRARGRARVRVLLERP